MRASLVTAEDIKAVFFRAMQVGWVTEGEGVPIEGRPGNKCVEYIEEDWLVVDEYSTTRGKKSGGTTRIWFRNVLVWEMHYWGEYDERAISILKEALFSAYRIENFFGSRGPRTVSQRGLEYRNNPSHSSNFAKFSGHEKVVGWSPREKLGYHEYAGMLMVDLPLPDSTAELIIAAVGAELAKVDFASLVSAVPDPVFDIFEVKGLLLEDGFKIERMSFSILDRFYYFHLDLGGWELDVDFPRATSLDCLKEEIMVGLEVEMRKYQKDEGENFPYWNL